MKPFIETFTGLTFAPLAPEPGKISVFDIAHALSNQGRFTGHTRFRYSVAEHSVRVSELLERWMQPIEVQLWGLLHDASEAYLVDLPTPLKLTPEIGEPYKKAEAALMHAVCLRFGLPLEQPEAVTRADAVMLATEVRDLMHGDRDYWQKISAKPIPEPYRIRPWGADVAEAEFMRRFLLLGGS